MTDPTKTYKNPRLTQIACEAGLGHTWAEGETCRRCALVRCPHTKRQERAGRCSAALYKGRCPYHGGQG